jgi:hypothetical protein
MNRSKFRRLFVSGALTNSIRNIGRILKFSAIGRTAAKGIGLSHDRSLLFENGGHFELTKSWAKSLLKRMNMELSNPVFHPIKFSFHAYSDLIPSHQDHHLNLFHIISVSYF